MYPHQSDQSQSGPTSCPAFSPAGGLNGATCPQNVNLPRLLIAPHWALWFPGQRRHGLHGEIWEMYSCSFSLCLFSTGVLQKELSRHCIHQPRGYEHLQWTALGLNNFWNSAVTAGVQRLFRRPSPAGVALCTLQHTPFSLCNKPFTCKISVSGFLPPPSFSDFRF